MTELRQIKIKSGVVKRLHKEAKMYAKEANDELKRLDNISTEDEEGLYRRKKQEEVLRECKAMIPDSQKRLKTAIADLEKLMAESEHVENIKESEEHKAALEILTDAKME